MPTKIGSGNRVDNEDTESLNRFFKDSKLAGLVDLVTPVQQGLAKSTRCFLQNGVQIRDGLIFYMALSQSRSIAVFPVLREFGMDFTRCGSRVLVFCTWPWGDPS